MSPSTFWVRGILHPIVEGADPYGNAICPNELEGAVEMLEGKPVYFEHTHEFPIGKCKHVEYNPEHGILATCEIPLDGPYAMQVARGVWEGKFTGFSFGGAPLVIKTPAGPAVIAIKPLEASVVETPGIDGALVYKCGFLTEDGKTYSEKRLSDAVLCSTAGSNPLIAKEITTTELPPCLQVPSSV